MRDLDFPLLKVKRNSIIQFSLVSSYWEIKKHRYAKLKKKMIKIKVLVYFEQRIYMFKWS